MILFGGQSGFCVPGDEKAKSGSYGALDAMMTYHTLCYVQWLQNVIRKKRGPAAYWTSEYNHVLDRAINIF